VISPFVKHGKFYIEASVMAVFVFTRRRVQPSAERSTTLIFLRFFPIPVTLVRTDVSEERIASIIRETRIGEIGTTFAVSSNEARCAATRRHSSQDGSVHFCSYSSCNILRSHVTRLPNSKYFHHFKKHSSMVRCTGNRRHVHFLKTGRNRLVCGRGWGALPYSPVHRAILQYYSNLCRHLFPPYAIQMVP
jgi:hypothetical protein